MAVETSIVIRTLNEAKHLGSLLKGIHGQNYHDWEIVLVDSGSTDGSVDIARQYGARIFHIPKEEFTFGRSLNLGCDKALGRYLVFASGHVRPITNNWLRNLVRPFEEPSVAMVYGRQRGTEASRLSEIRDLDTWFGPTSNILVDEAKANNGNSAIRRELWLEQSFDESLPGLEDVDWARKVEHKGYRVYYAADAAVYHIHEESLKQVYRRYLREAIAAKQMFPNFHYTWSDLVKGFPYFVLRDLLFAFRHGKHSKVPEIPGSRLAQFLGMYRGVRYQKRLSRDVAKHLEVPETQERVVVSGPGLHQLEREKIPQLEPDQVLVQIAYVGVCVRDLEMDSGSIGRDGALRYPAVPGQEYSGIVVRTGANAVSLRRGQKVSGRCVVGCGRCSKCGSGDHSECANNADAGLISPAGAYSQFLAIDSKYLQRLPAEMSLKNGVLVQPVATCLEGLRKLAVRAGQFACVVGAGTVGNLCAQVLATMGLHVTAVDPDAYRLGLLYKYDIDTLTKAEDLERFDCVVAASGNFDVLPQLVAESSPTAKVLVLGPPYHWPLQDASVARITSEKVVWLWAASQKASWNDAIRLVNSGAVKLDDHTTEVEPLEHYRKAWSGIETRRSFNVLLRVSDELAAL